jgi:hypothetical protein
MGITPVILDPATEVIFASVTAPLTIFADVTELSAMPVFAFAEATAMAASV